MADIKLERINCIAIGRFNIHIIEPKWLAEQGILEPGLEIGVETNVKQPGLRITYHEEKVRWVITPSCLIIETTDLDYDCSSVMTKVLKTLRHTPLDAIGKNYDFTVDKALVDKAGLFDRLKGQKFPSSFKNGSMGCRWTLKKGGHDFNLQINMNDETTTVHVNVHRELSCESLPPERAVESLGLFNEHLKDAEALVADLFEIGEIK